MHLCLDVARTQVVDEQAFEQDATALDAARLDDEYHGDNTHGDDDGRRKVEQVLTDVEHVGDTNEASYQDGGHQRRTVAVALCPQGLPLLAVVLLHNHGPQEGGNEEDGEQAYDELRYGQWIIENGQLDGYQLLSQWQSEDEHHSNDGCREDAVDNGVDNHLLEQLLPFATLGGVRMAHRQVVERTDDARGQSMLKGIVGRGCQANHVGREEGGDHRYSHHHRIEEVADDAQGQTQGGDDERELTNLRHREAAAHGRLQRLAAQHERERAHGALSDNDGQDECQDGQGIIDDDLRIDEHTHRHEEDSAKEVFHRLYQLLDAFGLDGLGQDAAHDESTKGRRETYLRGEDSHSTAESQRHDEQHLGIDEAAHPAQEQRDGEDAHHEPQHQEEHDLHDGTKHLTTIGTVAAGNGTQHHHHDDGKDVLEDEDAHHQTRELLLSQTQIGERLIYNSGGRHGQHTAQEDAVHLGPAEGLAHDEAQRGHRRNNTDNTDDGRGAHLQYFLEREVESQREQQEHHADVGPQVDVGHVGDACRIGHVGTDQEARNDIAQHQRLLQMLEDEGYNAGDHQDERQVGNHCR